MPLPKPIATEFDPHRNTTRARLDDGTTGEYYLKGGISWPTMCAAKDGRATMQGYAVLVGVNIRTDKAVVWAWRPFNTISAMVADTALQAVPLAPWLNMQWAQWYANAYYWHDKGETHHQFRRQLHRDGSVLPKPRLSAVLWDDDAAAEAVFWLAANEKRLVMEKEFAADVTSAEPGKFCPARHALVCALAGLHKRPWSDPGEKPFVLDDEWT